MNDHNNDTHHDKESETFAPSDQKKGCHPTEGSVQEVLFRCVGRHVTAEFLVGTDTMVSKSGILYEVGMSYITLYDEGAGAYTICDFYAIKFVTLADPAKRGQRRK
jgi:hypothetical protein